LGIAEFLYNNKTHSSTQTLPFKANYGQDPRIGFEGRKKGKYEGAEKFVEKIQEKAKCEGNQSRALQKIPQFKLCYRICYNSPPGDSLEN